MKLNFNGAAKGNPSMTVATGVITDSRGIFITFYFRYLGMETNYQAEMEALMEGIRFSLKPGP
jgi:ribonuclease HI